MIIGLSGVAASGKSWAAKELASQLGYEYISSKAAEVANDIGFDVNEDHSFSERLIYQRAVLKRMSSDLKNCWNRNIVLDRTPLDLMTYAAISKEGLSTSGELNNYIESCYSILDICFDMVVLISPPFKDLAGMGEYKTGRIITDKLHGNNHRIVFDNTIKILANKSDVLKKLLVVPEDLHYQDRVEYVKDRINDYRNKSRI